jgi:hypothetical protein
MSIDALICPSPPEQVFHYTDQGGLFGILRSGEVWASRIHCLNDHQEFLHGLDALREAIVVRGGARVPTEAEDQVTSAFDSIRKVNVCVSCWSEHRDQLSQWRAYAKSRQGYALGLKAVDLKLRAQLAGWKFGKCLYKDEDKRTLSTLVAQQFWVHVGEHEKANPTLNVADRIALILHGFVFPYVAFFKHEGFSEESEWRLVSPMIRRTDPLFTVRPGTSFPITYYRFDISGGALGKLEAEIVVGPGASQELASHGAAVASIDSKFDVKTRRYSGTPWRTDT